MAWTTYSSQDAGARQLSGAVAKLDDIVSDVLTGPSGDGTGNAYGSTPCAGWIREFINPGANIIAVRPGPGAASRPYYRIDDSAPTADPRIAHITGYHAMSTHSIGTTPFPYTGIVRLWSGYLTGGDPTIASAHYITKSATADATNRPWYIFADDKTAIIAIQTGQTGTENYWSFTYLGEAFSNTTGDAYKSMLVAGWRDALNNDTLGSCQHGGFVTQTGIWVAGDHRQVAVPVMGNLIVHDLQSKANSQYASGWYGKFDGANGVNPADGKLWWSPVIVTTHIRQPEIRGRLRGLYASLSAVESIPDGDTFSIGGDTFKVFWIRGDDSVNGATNLKGMAAVQTSEPASSG